MSEVLSALSFYPLATAELLRQYEAVANGEIRLSDIISGFDDEPEPEADLPAAVLKYQRATFMSPFAYQQFLRL